MRPERETVGRREGVKERRREVYCGEEVEEKSMAATEGSYGEQTRGVKQPVCGSVYRCFIKFLYDKSTLQKKQQQQQHTILLSEN